MKIACLVIASWLSIFDSSMDKFADQYVSEMTAAKMNACALVIERSSTRRIYDREDFEYKMQVNARNKNAYTAAKIEERERMAFDNRMAAIEKQEDIAIENASKECEKIREEYSFRKSAFSRNKNTKRSDVEESAFVKFEKNKCKIKSLSEDERETLHRYFIRCSNDWTKFRDYRYRKKTINQSTSSGFFAPEMSLITIFFQRST